MDYQEAKELIASKKRGYKDRAYLCYKTWVVELDGCYGIQHHDSVIVRFYPDGRIVLDSCGYRTTTTKQRMNEYLPSGFMVYQKDSIWYLWIRNGDNDRSVLFQDGIEINPGSLFPVTGAGGNIDELKKLNGRIVKYVHAFVKNLLAGKVPAPSSGDCWDCAMRVQDTGKTLGDTMNSDHILSHIEEHYYVPTLLVNAVEEFPVSQVAMWAVGAHWYPGEGQAGIGIIDKWGDLIGDQLRRSLRRYIRRRLGLAS